MPIELAAWFSNKSAARVFARVSRLGVISAPSIGESAGAKRSASKLHA
jgi:hypothetical protein